MVTMNTCSRRFFLIPRKLYSNRRKRFVWKWGWVYMDDMPRH